MSIQIAVRLPDALVKDVDQLVSSGAERSRATVIERALQRELRRVRITQELALLRSGDENSDDLSALAAYAAATPLEID